MGNVSLIAIGIDEIRELFSGNDTRVRELSEITEHTWPQPAPRAGLLSKLGPFSRRASDAPVIYPGVPTRAEIEAVAQGRDVPAERLTAAWALVGAWLSKHGWGHVEVEIDPMTVEGFDFALATHGVPAEMSLRGLFKRAISLPLKPLPGQAVSYTKGTQAIAMASHWRAVLPSLSFEHRALAEPVTSWLDQFPVWTQQAAQAGRPAPDLVAAYRA